MLECSRRSFVQFSLYACAASDDQSDNTLKHGSHVPWAWFCMLSHPSCVVHIIVASTVSFLLAPCVSMQLPWRFDLLTVDLEWWRRTQRAPAGTGSSGTSATRKPPRSPEPSRRSQAASGRWRSRCFCRTRSSRLDGSTDSSSRTHRPSSREKRRRWPCQPSQTSAGVVGKINK